MKRMQVRGRLKVRTGVGVMLALRSGLVVSRAKLRCDNTPVAHSRKHGS